MTVVIVDYGMGNLASVLRALEECGATAEVAADPAALERASHVVLPGVGAFGDAMTRLAAGGWISPLQQLATERVPLLGICLGMQLLADCGEEGGAHDGLGLVPGRVVRLQPTGAAERVPHVGWNEVVAQRADPLLASIPPRTDFYFVHSYHFVVAKPEQVVARTPYCAEFVSVVRAGSVTGTQFHPEKSSRAGLRLLRNFLDHRGDRA
jgi:glutamine amidotransferase